VNIVTNDCLRFTYCGMGKRIKKIEKPDGQNSDTTSYAYDGMYAVCEFGNYDSLLSKYVYANGLLLARCDSSGAKYYYHHDGLGSTMGLTNTSKTVVKSYFYDDFGNSLGSWGNVSNHYRYTGQEYDDEISGAKLYNLRARYYDSGVGRFVSEDPLLGAQHSCYMSRCFTSLTYLQQIRLFEPIESNAYLYCGNNPTNNKDITGLQADWYAACATVAACIEGQCKALIDTCLTEEKESEEEQKCRRQAYDWFLDCIRYKTTPLPPIPYFICRGLADELFPYE